MSLIDSVGCIAIGLMCLYLSRIADYISTCQKVHFCRSGPSFSCCASFNLRQQLPNASTSTTALDPRCISPSRRPHRVYARADKSRAMATQDRTSYESDTDSVDVDAAQYDQETLTAEEEVERLLADSGKSQHDRVHNGRSSKRRSGQRVWRGSRGGEESEMMLQVEVR